jgi:hypothetical protein
VIDSLSGFEIALAPAFREDFQESLYRLVGALTAAGVTVMLTAELVGGYGNVPFTSDKVSFITDNMIAQRYIEIGGKLQKVLAVVKMRGSEHSKEFRTYELGSAGATIGGPLIDYHGITTGTPDLLTRPASAAYIGLNDREISVLQALIRLGTATGEVLASRVGLLPEDLAAVTARLVALGYAVAIDEDAQTFRAVAK